MSDPTTPAPRKKIPVKAVSTGVAALVVLVFILQNTQDTKLTFITKERQFPLWIVLVITAIVGGIVGQLIERMLRKEHK
ncbi:MAG: LapA family protein, partial [Acidimicrobiia bacterium]